MKEISYMDVNSERVAKVDKVPIHNKMKPYTMPAGPPLEGNLAFASRYVESLTY